MRNRAIQSNLPFVSPIDEVTDQEFASREAHKTTIISGNPSKFHHHDGFQPHLDEERSMESMINDDSTSVGAHVLFSSFHSMQKPSSSRPIYVFGLRSSSSKHVDEEIQIDDQVQEALGGKTKANPPK